LIDGTALEIARFLAGKAAARSRTTYEEVAQEIGWGHPTGRGLGKHLYEVMHHCKAQSLPPLTLIVVKKGTRIPSPEALPHISAALGKIDIEAKQEDVFAFNWTSIPELALPRAQLPDGRDIWLTSFWRFEPESWGCIGFATKATRDYFIRRTRPGVIVAIYVTKGKGLKSERSKILGLVEVSHQEGHAREFISGDRWAVLESDPETRGKWLYSLKVTHAWRIAEEDQKPIDELLPETYDASNAEFIGSHGVPVKAVEVEKLLLLTVYEVPVYGQTDRIRSAIQSFAEALKPSRAVYPAIEPYWVGETDGPKHLYILRLKGDLVHYLGRTKTDLEEKMIVKVGFSKSPLSRRNQIQAAYPHGAYKWEVLYPKEIPPEPPYPNAEVAIAGEDAMKKRLVDDGGESLGGEFFLADEGLVIRTWTAGKYGADEKMKRIGSKL
jgi:hypothetical protein